MVVAAEEVSPIPVMVRAVVAERLAHLALEEPVAMKHRAAAASLAVQAEAPMAEEVTALASRPVLSLVPQVATIFQDRAQVLVVQLALSAAREL